MSIHVRYFASLRDKIRRSSDNLETSESLTVRELWYRLNPDLALPDNLLAALNQQYVDLDAPVADGDEVAFSRPLQEVEMWIEITDQPIDAWQALQTHQQTRQSELQGHYGATSIFIGTMRDFNQGDEVRSMFLEHYPGMTEQQLRLIVVEAQQQWRILDALVIHRVGEVSPNDVLVVVASWSAHRGDAFDASRFIMEALKSRAPFWKRETLATGEQRWVDGNSNGYQTD